MYEPALLIGATVGSVVRGFVLGASIHPVPSLLGAAAAAGLCGHPRAGKERIALGALALLVAWVVGEGFALLAGSPLVTGGGTWTSWVLLGSSMLTGLGAGYALPAWAGAFVGRRVVKGTGWASAIVIALLAAGGMQALLGSIGGLAG